MSLHTRTVLIKNISEQATKEELKKLCEACGTVEHILTPAKDVYYVVYTSQNSAVKAIEKLNGQQLKTRKLVVTEVTSEHEMTVFSLITSSTEFESTQGATAAPLSTLPKDSLSGSSSSAVDRLTTELLKLTTEDITQVLSVLMDHVRTKEQQASTNSNRPSTPVANDLKNNQSSSKAVR